MRTIPTHRYRLTSSAPAAKTLRHFRRHTAKDTDLAERTDERTGLGEHPHKAYLALRTVLHALRDRLTLEEAVQLGAQLPMLVRGFYYEGWTLKKETAQRTA